MKKLLLLFIFTCYFGYGQSPMIGTSTVIPQNPTPTDFIKIVTKVTTPNLGVGVELSHTVTTNPAVIKLKGCYGTTMAPALQTFIDTFYVGQLQPGNYTIRHKAYMSSTNQHCTPIDSNEVITNVVVTSTTFLKENNFGGELQIFPNPVSDILFLTSGNNESAEVFSCDGKVVLELKSGTKSFAVSGLANGIYFIRFSEGNKTSVVKFVKQSAE
jgi:hypothetical protein